MEYKNDFCIINPANDKDSFANRFVTDLTVRETFERLALARCPRGVAENEEIYSVLRVLTGPETDASSLKFHYDAAVVTMLVPLFIPSVGIGNSGDLVVFPNRRPFRRSAIVNIFEKLFTQNWFYRKRIARGYSSSAREILGAAETG